MQILVLFFIGVVQGITEFLPVSSSGHIVLFSKIFGVEESLFLSVLLHVATLLSVIVVYRKDIFFMLKNPLSKRSLLLACATIPTCLIALVLTPIIENAFDGKFLCICFLLSAIILFLGENFSKIKTERAIGFKDAIFIGVAQGFAVFPGISRSGSTISAALANGNKKEESVKFSFLMSIPIILASLVLEIFNVAKSGIEFSCPIGGCLAFFVAFICGIFSIKFVSKMAKNTKLKWFGFYLLILSVVCFFIF